MSKIDWVPEASRAGEEHMKKARRENFKTFGKGYLAEDAKKKGNVPEGPKNSSLIAKFFKSVSLQTPSLPQHLLPPREFIDSTIESFAAMRDNITHIRLCAEEAQANVLPESVAAKLPKRPVFVPKSSELPHWYRFVEQAMYLRGSADSHEISPTLSPTMALVVHMELSQVQSLLTVLVRRLHRVTRGTSAVAATPPPAEELPSKRSRREGSEDEQELSGIEEEEAPLEQVLDMAVDGAAHPPHQPGTVKEVFASPEPATEVKESLRFIGNLMVGDTRTTDAGRTLSRRCGYGFWLYVVLATINTPLDPTAGRLLQQLFASCCKCLRQLSEAHPAFRDLVEKMQNGAVPAADIDETHEAYTTGASCLKSCDIVALWTYVVILGKYFGQANAELVPL